MTNLTPTNNITQVVGIFFSIFVPEFEQYKLLKQIQLADKTFKLSISYDKIDQAISSIAHAMNHELKDKDPLFLCVLNGSFMFAADLMKKLDFASKISFVKFSSYEGAQSTGQIKSLIGLNESIENKTIIVLEDIVDTGLTLDNLKSHLTEHNPKEVKIASLFFKPTACKTNIKIDYLGFEIPDDFVVGYGLDYDGYGRNLADLYTLII